MAEIPQDRWPAFCDDFNRQHHGWRVNVDLLDTRLLDTDPAAGEAAAQVLARERVFQGLVPEQREDRVAFSLILAEERRHLTHPITAPLRLYFEEGAGLHRGLRVDIAGGQTLRIRFRAPAVPESLDGLSGTER